MKEDSEKVPQSPEQIVDHLHVTSVPTYLLAMANSPNHAYPVARH